MTRAFLVCDLDNTVLDPTRRKVALLQALGLSFPSESAIREDVDFSWIPKSDARREGLIRAVYGSDFLSDVDAFPHAADVLNSVIEEARSAKLELVYLTGRSEEQRQVTVESLDRLGFPSPTNAGASLRMRSTSNSQTFEPTEERLVNATGESKAAHLAELLEVGVVVCLIGDSDSEISLSERLGIPSIQFSVAAGARNKTQTSERSFSIICRSWLRIAHELRSLTAANAELMSIVDRHSAEYVSFLRDEDTKLDIILKVCGFLVTFSAAGFWLTLNLATSSIRTRWITFDIPETVRLLFFVAILCFLMSSLFAIRGVASRHTRGKLTGQPIFAANGRLGVLGRLRMVALLAYNMARLAVGLGPKAVGGPVVDQSAARKRLETAIQPLDIALEFFTKNYGSWDGVAIRSIRLFDLRAIIYLKIAQQQAARVMLGIGTSVLLLALLVLSAHSNVH